MLCVCVPVGDIMNYRTYINIVFYCLIGNNISLTKAGQVNDFFLTRLSQVNMHQQQKVDS